MQTIRISDLTLRVGAETLSFKEKLELARGLDRLKVDAIELPPIENAQADALSNKTIAHLAQTCVCAQVGQTEESVETVWETIRVAKNPMLQVAAPVSPVQMEYVWHKKAPVMLKTVEALVRKCRFYCEQIEFAALDATRAEREFLYQILNIAVEAGATRVTLCDTAGILLPEECAAFIRDVRANVPALEKAELFLQVSDEIHMAAANAATAITAGVNGVKCAVVGENCLPLEVLSHILRVKGWDCTLRDTELNRNIYQLKRMLESRKSEQSLLENIVGTEAVGLCLSANDEIGEVTRAVRQLGYDLTEEDYAKVFESFRQVAARKPFVSSRELDAIVAASAMQVPSAYRVDSFVINCGNIITATANVCLERGGEKLRSISAGDGPIDAAFLAIEQIIGHHYELDDFQIQTVTEGREAMGSAIVKLRAGGKLYSGNGISTDIIGASIRAYVNALNKIVYEEE